LQIEFKGFSGKTNERQSDKRSTAAQIKVIPLDTKFIIAAILKKLNADETKKFFKFIGGVLTNLEYMT
jgi:hypothetical protein